MEIPIVLVIIVTFFSPYVNAYIQKVTWSSQTKNLIALTVSAVIALGYLFLTGGIGDWSQISIWVPAVYGLQQAVYNFILKNSASKFEAATTKGAVVVSPAQTPGTVNVSTDSTIEDGTQKEEVSTPLQVTSTDPVVEIVKPDDVRG
jgi:hypothetical protein